MNKLNEPTRELQAAKLIRDAETELGHLTRGQVTDLLLDNFPELRDSAAARALLAGLDWQETLGEIVRIPTGERLRVTQSADGELQLVGATDLLKRPAGAWIFQGVAAL